MVLYMITALPLSSIIYVCLLYTPKNNRVHVYGLHQVEPQI